MFSKTAKEILYGKNRHDKLQKLLKEAIKKYPELDLLPTIRKFVGMDKDDGLIVDVGHKFADRTFEMIFDIKNGIIKIIEILTGNPTTEAEGSLMLNDVLMLAKETFYNTLDFSFAQIQIYYESEIEVMKVLWCYSNLDINPGSVIVNTLNKMRTEVLHKVTERKFQITIDKKNNNWIVHEFKFKDWEYLYIPSIEESHYPIVILDRICANLIHECKDSVLNPIQIKTNNKG